MVDAGLEEDILSDKRIVSESDIKLYLMFDVLLNT